MIDTITDVLRVATQITLGLAITGTLYHLVRVTRLLDRVIALEVLAALTVAIAAVITLTTGVIATIDIALVVALISFTGTVAFAAFVESRRDNA